MYGTLSFLPCHSPISCVDWYCHRSSIWRPIWTWLHSWFRKCSWWSWTYFRLVPYPVLPSLPIPDWAFPFDERCWNLLTKQRQCDLHLIFSVLLGYTGPGVNLVAPDFPWWAHPITHEHCSTFCLAKQHIVGQILNNMQYWRGMLLPGDAAFAAGLICRQYDADIPY
jgi:hypothetical protein